jgi:NitT/TauT family transport system substrate-binding protein
MTRTQRWWAVLAAALVAVACAGCGDDGAGASAGAGPDEVQITVSHYPSTLHSVPFMVGMEQGFFRDHDITIKRVIGGSGGGTTTRNVLAGRTEFGQVALPSALQAVGTGAPLVMVAGGSDNLDELHFVGRKDADISSAKDMIGKTWGFTNPASVTDSASRLIFEKAGIDPKQVDFKAAGGIPEGLTLLKEGDLDAAALDDPNFSVQKDQWKDLFSVADYVKKIQQDVIVTSPQLAQRDPDLVKRFLAALHESNEWLYAHPEEAAQIFARRAEIDEKASLAAVRTQVDSRRWNLALSPEGIQNMVHGAQLAGALPKDVEIPWGQVLDQEFLPAGVAKVDPKTLPGYVDDGE